MVHLVLLCKNFAYWVHFGCYPVAFLVTWATFVVTSAAFLAFFTSFLLLLVTCIASVGSWGIVGTFGVLGTTL